MENRPLDPGSFAAQNRHENSSDRPSADTIENEAPGLSEAHSPPFRDSGEANSRQPEGVAQDASNPAADRRPQEPGREHTGATAGSGETRRGNESPQAESGDQDASRQESSGAGGGSPPEGTMQDLRTLLRKLDPNNFQFKDLNDIVNAALDLKIDETVQHQLVRLLSIISRLERLEEDNGKNEGFQSYDGYGQRCKWWAAHVVSALLKSDPEIVVARGLMALMETELLIEKKMFGHKVFSFAKYLAIDHIIPIVTGIVLSALVFTLVKWWGPFDYLLKPSDVIKLDVITTFAFLGGIASLIVRLPAMSALQDEGVLIILWTAFFKPFVAVLFSVVVYCAIRSGVVNIFNAGLVAKVSFLGFIGFLSGWSERFATDIIDKAAQQAPSGSGNPRPGIAEVSQ